MSISRRSFLQLGIVTSVAALGAVTASRAGDNAAQAGQSPGRQEFRYRGRQVVIDETDQTVSVMINGVHQHHIQKKVPRRGPPFLVSHLLPFENFNNASQLVKTLIDLETNLELFVLT